MRLSESQRDNPICHGRKLSNKLLGFGWNIRSTSKIQPKRQQINENWRQTYTYIDKKLRAEAGRRHPEKQQGLSHPMVRLRSALGQTPVHSICTWLLGKTLIASYSFNVDRLNRTEPKERRSHKLHT